MPRPVEPSSPYANSWPDDTKHFSPRNSQSKTRRRSTASQSPYITQNHIFLLTGILLGVGLFYAVDHRGGAGRTPLGVEGGVGKLVKNATQPAKAKRQVYDGLSLEELLQKDEGESSRLESKPTIERDVEYGTEGFDSWGEVDDEQLEDLTGEKKPFGKLRIHQLYHSPRTWPMLANGTLYRGLCRVSGARRRNTDDVDLSQLLPILDDKWYQNQLADVGALLALARHLDYMHAEDWIGFQSWHAQTLGVALSPGAEKSLLEAIEEEQFGQNALFFWAVQNDTAGFYAACDKTHQGQCSAIYEKTFQELFGKSPEDSSQPPPMPVDASPWASATYWALHKNQFKNYAEFVRLFTVALDHIYHHQVHEGDCPLTSAKRRGRHCYSYLLEPLINIYAYHNNLRLVYLNPATGELSECRHLTRNKQWAHAFDERAVQRLKARTQKRAREEGTQSLYYRMGGELPETSDEFRAHARAAAAKLDRNDVTLRQLAAKPARCFDSESYMRVSPREFAGMVGEQPWEHFLAHGFLEGRPFNMRC